MSEQEMMTVDERRKYLRLMKPRYLKAGRKEKGQLLDEMETVTGMDRKALIRLLKGDLARTPRRRERGRSYGPELDDVLRVIDESFDGLCAQRLVSNLAWMAQVLAAHSEVTLTPALLADLERVSRPTIARRLAHIRQDQPRLPRRKPRPRNAWLAAIPMRRLSWDLASPGYFETDLVHHSGPAASGEYVCTLQMVDVLTGWSERWAVLGRSYLVMEDAFRAILQRLPFPVVELHPDNGSEFFNAHLVHFWDDLVQGVTLSRSRPYHKNDNPRIEQKNDTLVRAYLGYERLDSVAQVLALNRLYARMWVYYNLFQPVLHLVDKEVVQEEGQAARVRRRYDEPRTPFDRLCQTGVLLPEHQAQLTALRDATNPRRLHQEIADGLDQLFLLPGASADHTEDVYQTLASQRPPDPEGLFALAFNRTPIRG